MLFPLPKLRRLSNRPTAFLIGKLRRLVPAFAAGFIFAAPVAAQDAPACAGKDLSDAAGVVEAKTKRADDLVNGEGLFWRIEKPGEPVSYLFGTIHSTDAKALAFARRAAATIPSVKAVATELGPMDATEKANVSAAFLAKALERDHDTFDAVPEKDRAAVEKMVTELGYPSEFAHHLKLWFLAVLTATPACETKRASAGLPEMDEFLMDEAQRAGVRVVGLETAQEQMDAVAAIDPKVAGLLLAVAARDDKLDDDVYATTLKLYLAERPADVLAVGDVVGDMSPQERDAQDVFTRLLLVRRNATMIERMGPYLREGAFVAVGALHLPGKDGLIARLRGGGYTVTKEW